MALSEKSWFWDTGGGGDDAQVTEQDFHEICPILGACMHYEGIAPSYLNGLAGTVTGANTVQIDTGGAVVDGAVYRNAGAGDINFPSAVGGGNTRVDRIVLRADWSANTVRLTRIAGVDAGSPTPPALTQTPGTTYDLPLYQALVDTSGNVTLTDERVWARPTTNSVATAAIQDGAVTTDKLVDSAVTAAKIATAVAGNGLAGGGGTALSVNVDNSTIEINSDALRLKDGGISTAKIANDAVDDTKVGNRVPQFYRRQGGSSSNWSTAGTDNHTPGAVRMQGGARTSLSSFGTGVVTFPTAFSGTPIVFVTAISADSTEQLFAYAFGITANSFAFKIVDENGAAVGERDVHWLAIGPE